MYCKKCGQQISEDSVYCAKCGEQVNILRSPVSGSIPSKKPWPYRFNSEWRNATRSPLFIVAAICLTIFHAVILGYIFTVTDLMLNEWKELDVVQYINQFAHYDDLSSKLNGFEFWAGVAKFLLIVSGFVSIVGIWLVYADSRSDPLTSIDDGNFVWLKFAQIVRCVGSVAAILIYNSLASNICSLYSGDNSFELLQFISENRIATIKDEQALLCAPYWVVLAYSIVMYVVVHKIHDMTVSRVPQPGAVVFGAVAFFAAAAVFLFVANIWGLLCGVFGVFFLVCYQRAEKLSEEHGKEKDNKNTLESDRGVSLNGWKCTCGRVNAGYVSSCACGKNKRNVE